MAMKARWLVLCLLSGLLAAETSAPTPTQIRSVLKKQGFSGLLNRDASISRLGKLDCSGTTFSIYYYNWGDSKPPHHGNQRIILLDSSNHYLGFYFVSDPPSRVTREALFFNYLDADGNVIRCDKNGLPASVHLNGSDAPIEK
jgi:hypothetical protein